NWSIEAARFSLAPNESFVALIATPPGRSTVVSSAKSKSIVGQSVSRPQAGRQAASPSSEPLNDLREPGDMRPSWNRHPVVQERLTRLNELAHKLYRHVSVGGSTKVQDLLAVKMDDTDTAGDLFPIPIQVIVWIYGSARSDAVMEKEELMWRLLALQQI